MDSNVRGQVLALRDTLTRLSRTTEPAARDALVCELMASCMSTLRAVRSDAARQAVHEQGLTIAAYAAKINRSTSAVDHLLHR